MKEMNWKYKITWADYPYTENDEGSYGTNSYIKFIFKLFITRILHDVIEIYY